MLARPFGVNKATDRRAGRQVSRPQGRSSSIWACDSAYVMVVLSIFGIHMDLGVPSTLRLDKVQCLVEFADDVQSPT